jgi:hypothetical protein
LALINRDVGFLRYWKVAQLPNFAIASPILVLSVYGLAKYGSHLYETPNQATPDRQRRLGHNDMAFWRNKEILPFFLIHLVTTWLVLFASHTECPSNINSESRDLLDGSLVSGLYRSRSSEMGKKVVEVDRDLGLYQHSIVVGLLSTCMNQRLSPVPDLPYLYR